MTTTATLRWVCKNCGCIGTVTLTVGLDQSIGALEERIIHAHNLHVLAVGKRCAGPYGVNVSPRHDDIFTAHTPHQCSVRVNLSTRNEENRPYPITFFIFPVQ